jgi:hypothetical protein
MEHLIQI